MILVGCAPPIHTFTVVAPAKFPETMSIKSIEVRPFKVLSKQGKNYSIQLKKIIEAGIANEGFIKVVNNNSKTLLAGDVFFGKLQQSKYRTSYKTKKGTYRIYHFVKKITISGNYSLFDQNEKRTIIGDSFNINFDRKWTSSQNYGEAKASASSDEQIIHLALKQIANKIVSGVSPHKERIKRELKKGSDSNIELGITYLVNGRVDQAVAIWDQVVNNTVKPQDKAAAYYNIGVVKEARGQYKDAFELFSKANSFDIKEELYMKAMTRVERSQQAREKVNSQTQ